MAERNVKDRTGGLEPGATTPDFTLPREDGGTRIAHIRPRVSVDGHAEEVLAAAKAL